MKRLAIWLIGVGLIGVITAHAAALAFPGIVMKKAVSGLSAAYGAGPNEFGHSGPITAENQRIVRPSPDLAYSICLYDVSAGPVEAYVPKAANYLSVALYDMGTNNFYHINDSEMPAAGVKIVLGTEEQLSTLAPAGSADNHAVVPTQTGLVLVRRVITGTGDWPVIEAERAQMSCGAATG